MEDDSLVVLGRREMRVWVPHPVSNPLPSQASLPFYAYHVRCEEDSACQPLGRVAGDGWGGPNILDALPGRLGLQWPGRLYEGRTLRDQYF